MHPNSMIYHHRLIAQLPNITYLQLEDGRIYNFGTDILSKISPNILIIFNWMRIPRLVITLQYSRYIPLIYFYSLTSTSFTSHYFLLYRTKPQSYSVSRTSFITPKQPLQQRHFTLRAAPKVNHVRIKTLVMRQVSIHEL